MQDIQYWQKKIQDKQKSIDFREFLKSVASWHPLVFHRNGQYISRYPETDRSTIVSSKDFHEKIDNLRVDYIYDPDQSFFENFGRLLSTTPVSNFIDHGGCENSEYADQIVNSKNVYLSSVVTLDNDTVLYSMRVSAWTNILNSLYVLNNSEVIYFSRWILNSTLIFYSAFIKNCNNIWFSSNLTGCSECILCNDLENSSYCIENTQYKKEQYFIKKQEILADKDQFLGRYKSISKVWKNHGSNNVTGSFVMDSQDAEKVFFTVNGKTMRNGFFIGGLKLVEDMYNTFNVASLWGSDFYGICGGWASENIYCSCHIAYGTSIYYSFFLTHCSFCIGCVGIQNKSYCIFNKQYSKAEWHIQADKIFSQMEKQGIIWDFFPGSINPFYFNDTSAWLLWDFQQSEVTKEGYMWRDEAIKVDIPDQGKLIEVKDLSDYQWYNEDSIWSISPEILKKIIKDDVGNYYRIVKTEYDFLIKHGLPLPELHWLERMKQNLGVTS